MCCRLFPGHRQVALHPGGERKVAAQRKALSSTTTTTPGTGHPPHAPGMKLRYSLGGKKPSQESICGHFLPFHILLRIPQCPGRKWGPWAVGSCQHPLPPHAHTPYAWSMSMS